MCMCEVVELEDGNDGYFYCKHCGDQAEGVRATAVDNYEMPLIGSGAVVRKQMPDVRKGAVVKQLSFDDYYIAVRRTYVLGVQMMIELQIKALVDKFNVCPIIVDMIEPIWLRFVASTNLFSDDWAHNAVEETESQIQGEVKAVRAREGEPRNFNGKRCVMIWYRSLRKTIPLSYSLAISFLACYLAREPILATDIMKWALEGELPYFAAFVEIDKQLHCNECPLTSRRMFRPTHVVPIQKLEALAASIAESIGLELPPVNFSAIASRYLKQLSLPVDIILPHACRIYEWSMPPELWLSASEFRLPTHAFVLSILVVSIRILYNIHGFGKWEMSLAKGNNEKKLKVNNANGQSEVDDSAVAEPCNKDLDATEILVLLQAKYNELIDTSDYAKDLKKYIKYCEDVVFAGVELSNKDENEDVIIKGLLQFYEKKNKSEEDDSAAAAAEPCNKDLDATEILVLLQAKYNELIDTSDCAKDLKEYIKYCEDVVFAGVELSKKDEKEDMIIKGLLQFYEKKNKDHKRPQELSQSNKNKKPKHDNVQITLDPKDTLREREIRRMKSNMEDNKFCYIPPRKRVKRHDYLLYTRKKGGGAYVYAAHADYYILLRSCARVAQLNVRTMHAAVLSFERRLGWLEKNIQHSFKLMPSNDDCEHCDSSKLKL